MNNMLDPQSLRNRLVQSRIATPRSIEGCTPEDIVHIERALGLPLPRAYVDFLECVGRRAGAFLRDIDIFYPRLLQLRSIAEDVLDIWEEEKLFLPTNSIVFAVRQGEQFMYFETHGDCDDPPIWYYSVGAGTFKKVADSIWLIIESELRLSEDFRRNYPDSPLIPDPE